MDSTSSTRRTPLVSVVIPTYNRADLLPAAIRSACAQSYAHLEILVVDDGSTDETAAAVHTIGDPRVRHVPHPRNKGLPAARNTGIRAARGEYVAFLDDDDAWHPEKIAKQVAAIPEFDALLTAAVADGRILRRHDRPTVTLEDLRRASFDPSSLMARTSVLREVLFDEALRQGEDWDAFIRIARRYSIGWLAEPLLYYNAGPHARMTNEKRTLAGSELEKRTAMLRKHRDFFGERWFAHHMAETFLGFIGSRSNKWHYIGYAVKRCGVGAVARVLLYKLYRRWLPGVVAGDGLATLWRMTIGAGIRPASINSRTEV